MRSRKLMRRRIWSRSLIVLLIALMLAPVIPIGAQQVLGVNQISQGGFGDRSNSYSWAMAWFKGKLYVGTAQDVFCVEAATLEFYFPEQNHYPPTNPSIPCPDDQYDLELQAEIWRYTPATGAWDRVFQSPTIPNPRAPGKEVARDIGFRGMVVYEEPDGTEALYVGNVTANQYIPELAPEYGPRMLRTTDGETFEEVPGGLDFIQTIEGDQHPIGYRAMEIFDDRMFVTLSRGLTGDGAIVEITEPWSDNPQYEQVSPSDLQVFELAVFDGWLYAGAGNLTEGYSVWKSQVPSFPGSYIPVISGGAGRGPAVNSVVSMQVFEDRLYVGANGWYQTLFPGSELVRINPNGSWDLVVGRRRFTSSGFKFPISGFSDGFNNIFNAHFWRMMDYGNTLELGTNDWSHQFANIPLLGPLLSPGFGFDIWGSCDGRFWWAMTRNAFGDGRHNFGARTMQAAGLSGGFIGSANHVEGTAIWHQQNLTRCIFDTNSLSQQPDDLGSIGPNGFWSPPEDRTPSTQGLEAPEKVVVDFLPCGAVVSWDRSRGASRYRILRSTFNVAKDVTIPEPIMMPGGGVPSYPPMTGELTVADIEVPGEFASIGATYRNYYVDTNASPDGKYLYQVIADPLRGSGQSSAPSNIALAPAEKPTSSFDELRLQIESLDEQGSLVSGAASDLLELVDEAEAAFESGDRRGALRALVELISELVTGDVLKGQVAEADVRNLLSGIQRVISVHMVACSSARFGR